MNNKRETICKAALEYWYSLDYTWEQVDKILGIKGSGRYRKRHNVQTRSYSDAVRLGHKNMSEETKQQRHENMSKNHWMRRITEEQELQRLEKWQNTYDKNREINQEKNRQGQLKRFSDEQKRQQFTIKQRETKLKNGTLYPEHLLKLTHEQRSAMALKAVETKRKNGTLTGHFPYDRKDEILQKSYETKLKNGTLYTSHGANSKPNEQFAKLLIDNDIDFEREFWISPYSYDFKIDNILIEINPSVTHNSTWGIYGNEGKDKNYHLNKSKVAEDNGFRCIHIWDWDDVNKILFLLKSKETIYARKCVIREVSKQESKQFINTYHLQNYTNDQVRIGLYYNNSLVSIMTFGTPRYNKKFEWELIRYCSSKNIVGGAEKLFNYFIKNYTPKSIISYCDYSKFCGNVYKKLNFKLAIHNPPSKHWYHVNNKRHITDNLLRQRGFDQLFNTNYGKGTSNEELMLQNKFVEVYDCGQIRFEWESPTLN